MVPWKNGKSWVRECIAPLTEKQVAFINGLMKDCYKYGKNDGLKMCEEKVKHSRLEALKEMDDAHECFKSDIHKLRDEYVYNAPTYPNPEEPV